MNELRYVTPAWNARFTYNACRLRLEESLKEMTTGFVNLALSIYLRTQRKSRAFALYVHMNRRTQQELWTWKLRMSYFKHEHAMVIILQEMV